MIKLNLKKQGSENVFLEIDLEIILSCRLILKYKG